MRVIVVGRGARGRAWEDAVARRRDLRLVGTVDPEQSTGASWSALGDEALSSADAAILASPPEVHAAQAMRCVRAGLAVLVEKPLALATEDAAAVAAEATATGRPVVVGQSFAQRPLERGVATALSVLGPLRSGAVLSARAHQATPAHLAGLDHPPLWDFAIHHFDLMRRRAGGPPSTVEAARRGDTYRAAFHWPGGLEVGWWHDDGGGLFHRAEWWRADGGAVEVRGKRAWRLTEGTRPRRLPLPRGSAEARLLDALVRGDSDVDENVATVAMVTATVTAIGTGQPVEISAPGVTA